MNKHKDICDNFRVIFISIDTVCTNKEHNMKALALNKDIVQVPAPLDVHLLDPGQVFQLGHQIHALHVLQEETGGLE